MENKELPINVAMEYAKNDYVKSINEITAKYNLPMCLVESIIGSIFFEIKNISRQELENNIKNLEKEGEANENN
ncbi:MAG: hypothetical protein HFI86_02230 [Bacilli bacterium]|nr:hypothetical protein [Bacilli bacterium]